jgi:hypothetical protein
MPLEAEIQQVPIYAVDRPSNYNENNVQGEILPIVDSDAGAIIEAPLFECDVVSYILPYNCTISTSTNRTGDNHWDIWALEIRIILAH